MPKVTRKQLSPTTYSYNFTDSQKRLILSALAITYSPGTKETKALHKYIKSGGVTCSTTSVEVTYEEGEENPYANNEDED